MDNYNDLYHDSEKFKLKFIIVCSLVLFIGFIILTPLFIQRHLIDSVEVDSASGYFYHVPQEITSGSRVDVRVLLEDGRDMIVVTDLLVHFVVDNYVILLGTDGQITLASDVILRHSVFPLRYRSHLTLSVTNFVFEND